MHLGVELSSHGWETCQVDGCSHWMFCMAAEMLLKFLQSCKFFFFNGGCWGVCWCLILADYSLSKLVPLLVLVFVAWLCWGFHTCGNTFSIHFCSQQCGLWCAAKYLLFRVLVWHSFNPSLQSALVCFAWAAGEDELGCNVNSFKVTWSLFSLSICDFILLESRNPKSLFIIPVCWMSHFYV